MKPGLNQCTLRCALSVLMGLFFLYFGQMKVLLPEFTINPQLYEMIQQIFPVSGMMVMLMAVGVIAVELVGGVLVLAKKWVPKILYKLSLLGFFVITLTGLVGLHIPSGDVGSIVMHVVILAILGYLLHGCCGGCKKK